MVKSLSKNILNPFRNMAASARELGRRGKAELKQLGLWLLKFVAWAAYPLLTVGIITVSVVIPALWFGASEQAIRWAGFLLQLCGLCTVVYGIDETRELFGYPKLLSWPRDWIERFPRYRSGITLSASGSAMGLAGAKARAYVMTRAPATATLEERVKSLESNVEHIHKRIGEVINELDASINTHTQALNQERSERTAEDTKISEKLKLSHTGGLHISLMGAVWLFVGVILAGAAPEIACWVATHESY